MQAADVIESSSPILVARPVPLLQSLSCVDRALETNAVPVEGRDAARRAQSTRSIDRVLLRMWRAMLSHRAFRARINSTSSLHRDDERCSLIPTFMKVIESRARK